MAIFCDEHFVRWKWNIKIEKKIGTRYTIFFHSISFLSQRTDLSSWKSFLICRLVDQGPISWPPLEVNFWDRVKNILRAVKIRYLNNPISPDMIHPRRIETKHNICIATQTVLLYTVLTFRWDKKNNPPAKNRLNWNEIYYNHIKFYSKYFSILLHIYWNIIFEDLG